MNVPQKVKDAAQSLIDMYGLSFDYLGKYKDKEVYLYNFPEDANTGFPSVYLYKDNKVEEITGFEAMDIVNLFIKDFDKVEVE